jgi:hypothetical protein
MPAYHQVNIYKQNIGNLCSCHGNSTAGSLTTSAFAAKTKTNTHEVKSTSSTSTGLSKFISCVRALPTLTRADAVNCYNTVFSPDSSAGSAAGTAKIPGY